MYVPYKSRRFVMMPGHMIASLRDIGAVNAPDSLEVQLSSGRVINMVMKGEALVDAEDFAHYEGDGWTADIYICELGD